MYLHNRRKKKLENGEKKKVYFFFRKTQKKLDKKAFIGYLLHCLVDPKIIFGEKVFHLIELRLKGSNLMVS
jgi:hypothetical protein